MRKTQQTQHWARGDASEKKGGVIEAARGCLMVHINWGWFVWSPGSGYSSQVCRGPGRQMWGPLRSLQGQWRAVRRLRNALSVQCVCIGRNAFISVLFRISFVLITILAGSRHIEGVLTYAHNLLFGYMLILSHCVLMYKSFLFFFCVTHVITFYRYCRLVNTLKLK